MIFKNNFTYIFLGFFLSITYYKQFFREIPEMKWFAVIDFRDDKFSRQRVINISVAIKTVGKDWLVARNIRFAEAITNYTIISRTRVTVGLQYASTFLNFCCNVLYADHEWKYIFQHNLQLVVKST